MTQPSISSSPAEGHGWVVLHVVGHIGPYSRAFSYWLVTVCSTQGSIAGAELVPFCALPVSQPTASTPESSLACPPRKDSSQVGSGQSRRVDADCRALLTQRFARVALKLQPCLSRGSSGENVEEMSCLPLGSFQSGWRGWAPGE